MSDHSIVAALRSLPRPDTNCDNKGTVCVGAYEHENGEVEYDLHQCQFCCYRDSAADEIERLQAEVERLRDTMHEIKTWCRAYPRKVFIEPTMEQWKTAYKVLDNDHDCPSLTAISGSNMRHVVEGIQKIIDEQSND